MIVIQIPVKDMLQYQAILEKLNDEVPQLVDDMTLVTYIPPELEELKKMNELLAQQNEYLARYEARNQSIQNTLLTISNQLKDIKECIKKKGWFGR